MSRVRSTLRPASCAARRFWPTAAIERPSTVRSSIRATSTVTTSAPIATSGMPSTRCAIRSENSAGGLTLRPRPTLMATDITINEAASVAMIGGMRSSRINPKLKRPTPTPTAVAASSPGTSIALLPSITIIAAAPERAMVDGIERSALPGPTLITSICPSDTSTVKAENASAAVSRSPEPWPWPLHTVAAQASTAATHEPSHGRLPARRFHRGAAAVLVAGVAMRSFAALIACLRTGRSRRAVRAPPRGSTPACPPASRVRCSGRSGTRPPASP